MAPKLEPDAPETINNGNSLQKQIKDLQRQIEDSSKAHISELVKIRGQAVASEEELKSLRQSFQEVNAIPERTTKVVILEKTTEVEDPDTEVEDPDTEVEDPDRDFRYSIPVWPDVQNKSPSHVSFAQFCNFFATGPYLSEEDWYLIVPYLNEQKPPNFRELPLVNEFWEVGDTWGTGRTSLPSVASDGVLQSSLGLYAVLKYFSRPVSRQDYDWRNKALLSVRQLMKDMLSRGIAYRGLIRLIGNTAMELVDTGKLQKGDPLLFAIWQVVVCADEMGTHLLSSERRSIEDILTGEWSDIARTIMLQIQTKEHKDLCPFDFVLQSSLKPHADRIYFHTSKTGLIAKKDMETNQRRYILLDFDTKKLHVVEGERWDVKENGTMLGVRIFGNDEGTDYCFAIDKQSWEQVVHTLDG